MHPFVHLFVLDVVSDFFGTLSHLGMHKCPHLRPYHYVHHQKTSTFHNHPVDLVVMITAKLGVPLALLPVPSVGLLWCFLFATMFTSMAHHTAAPWGYWVSLCWVVPFGLRLPPSHHLVHHRDPNRHYGENWAVWDWCLKAIATKEPSTCAPPSWQSPCLRLTM